MITGATTAQLINGQVLADEVLGEAQQAVAKLSRQPKLVTIMVGDDAAMQYLANKQRMMAQQVGIAFDLCQLPVTTGKTKLVDLINQCNDGEATDAVAILMPPLGNLNPNYILSTLRTDKDANGLHPANVQSLIDGRQSAPMSPLLKAIRTVLKVTDVELKGKRAVIIARSGEALSRPLTWLLQHRRLTVDLALPDSDNLGLKTRGADVLITFSNRPGTITRAMVKPGAVVIDGGMSWVGPKQWAGDVAPDVGQVASWLTPVPDGIGPVAVAMLMQNTIQLSRQRQRACLPNLAGNVSR